MTMLFNNWFSQDQCTYVRMQYALDKLQDYGSDESMETAGKFLTTIKSENPYSGESESAVNGAHVHLEL